MAKKAKNQNSSNKINKIQYISKNNISTGKSYFKSNSSINIENLIKNSRKNKNRNIKPFKLPQKPTQTFCHLCHSLISRKNYRVHLFYSHKAPPPKYLIKKINGFSSDKHSSFFSFENNKKTSSNQNQKYFTIDYENKFDSLSLESIESIESQTNKEKKEKEKNNYSLSNIDSSSSEEIAKNKNETYIMHPDYERIEKEVDEYIKKILEKRKSINNNKLK